MRVLRPDVEPPTLSRQALQELQAVLVGVVEELEASWERRHQTAGGGPARGPLHSGAKEAPLPPSTLLGRSRFVGALQCP